MNVPELPYNAVYDKPRVASAEKQLDPFSDSIKFIYLFIIKVVLKRRSTHK